MNKDLVSLAKAVAEGDLGALPALIDCLKELGDLRRADHLLDYIDDVREAMNDYEEDEDYALSRVHYLRKTVGNICWPEISGESLGTFCNRLSTLVERAEESQKRAREAVHPGSGILDRITRLEAMMTAPAEVATPYTASPADGGPTVSP